ncbi:MAG: universal stress protein [Bacteroidota bacterium]|jgi:nucleotide-binding universal stress UspA family protein
MINLNTDKILVPLDFSETSMLAVRHACFLAQLRKGTVLLVHIVPKSNELLDVIQPELNLSIDMEKAANAIRNKLEDLAGQLHKEFGIAVNYQVSTGNVSKEILKICEEEKCGMIIMGTQGYSALEMIFIGSNTIKVLGDSDVPVMSVRTPASKNGYKNIILPIDESSHSRQKVNIAIEMAREFGAKLHVLGIVDSEDSSFNGKLDVIFKQIENIAGDKNVTCSRHRLINPDNKAESTLKFTNEVNGDLLVIMSDQNTELSGLFLGPYSSQLINSAKIPVLTLNPVALGEIYYSTPGTAGW